MVLCVILVDVFDLVIFGGMGDFVCCKIFLGLFCRFLLGQMMVELCIIGVVWMDFDDDGFCKMVVEVIYEFGGVEFEKIEELNEFLLYFYYVVIDVKGIGGWDKLKLFVCLEVVNVFYFFVVLSLFGDLVECLYQYGIVDEISCIVVEKLFGCDLEMVKVLNVILVEYFVEM